MDQLGTELVGQFGAAGILIFALILGLKWLGSNFVKFYEKESEKLALMRKQRDDLQAETIRGIREDAAATRSDFRNATDAFREATRTMERALDAWKAG